MAGLNFSRGERVFIRPPLSSGDQTLYGGTVTKVYQDGWRVYTDRGYAFEFGLDGWELETNDPAQLLPADSNLLALAEEANERRDLIRKIIVACEELSRSKLGKLPTTTLRFMQKVLFDLASRTEAGE